MMSDSNISQAAIPNMPDIKPRKALREVVPRKTKFGPFKVCYVQPDPLPNPVAMLQQLETDGLKFVKIPIDEKNDRLYLDSAVYRLIKLANIPNDYIDICINDYNRDQTPVHRTRLLNLINLSRNYCDYTDTEFLIETPQI